MADGQAHAGQLNTVMQEKRLFPPTAEFSAQASIKSPEDYQAIYDRAAADRRTALVRALHRSAQVE